MKNSKKGSTFVVIEGADITSYSLTAKENWDIGRPATENNPDIKIKAPTVSRKHAKLQNIDDIWFFLDLGGRNGTYHNLKRIAAGINGRVKPIMLKDKDKFLFGGHIYNERTAFGLYFASEFEGNWHAVKAEGLSQIEIELPGTTIKDSPGIGTVFDTDNGIAIYMGDVTFVIGDIKVTYR